VSPYCLSLDDFRTLACALLIQLHQTGINEAEKLVVCDCAAALLRYGARVGETNIKEDEILALITGVVEMDSVEDQKWRM
jgi:hypothetical protein